MPDSVAIVAGATGLVGHHLVRQLATDPAWREVRALTRRPLAPSLTAPTVVPVMVDYSRLEPPPEWARTDHVFCALGTTIRAAGSQEAFRRVDFEYPLALAKACLARGARHFLLVSAIGANPDSRMFYTRTKGEIEQAVSRLGYRSVTIARPSFLLGHRQERRLAEDIATRLGRLLPPRWRSIPAERVAGALLLAAKQDRPGVQILENAQLLKPN